MGGKAPQRIALFGGTFDPVHNGHLDLVGQAKATCQLDRVVFIPCARSPFKEDATEAGAEERFAMLEMAIAEKGWTDWAGVSRFEIDREPPSYSWRTAHHFRGTYPGAKLHWIVGGDQWEQLDRWAESEKLRQWLEFIVVTRSGSETRPRPDWRATFLEFDHPASASAIRDGRGDPQWLPVSVADFIGKRTLYSSGT